MMRHNRKAGVPIDPSQAVLVLFLLLAPQAACAPFQVYQTTGETLPAPEGEMLLNSRGGPSCYRLPDGSEVFLEQNTRIGLRLGSLHHEIILYAGKVTLVLQLPAGSFFTVIDPYGHLARLERLEETLVVVEYNDISGRFLLDCISGKCWLGKNTNNLMDVLPGQRMWLDMNSGFQGPFQAASIETPAACISGLRLPTQTFTPQEILPTASGTAGTATPATATPSTGTSQVTSTETPTPEGMEATSTAACATFQGSFPGTPCP